MTGDYHEHELRVRYAETDAMGVVYYANYFMYMESARSDMLIARGYPYSKLEKQEIYLPVKEAYCNFIMSARYEDVLVVRVKVAELRGASCRIEYEIVRKDDDKMIATGWTLHPFVNKNGRPIRIPQDFIQTVINEAKERG